MCKYEIKLELELTPASLEYVKDLESKQELASTMSYLLGRYGDGDIFFSTKSLIEMINKVLDNYEDNVEVEGEISTSSESVKDLVLKVDEMKKLLETAMSVGLNLAGNSNNSVESKALTTEETENESSDWDFDDLDNVVIEVDSDSDEEDDIDLTKLGDINKKLYGG